MLFKWFISFLVLMCVTNATGLLTMVHQENHTWIKEYKRFYKQMTCMSECVIIRNANATLQFHTETIIYLMFLNIPAMIKTYQFDDKKCNSILVTLDSYSNAREELKIIERLKSMYNIIIILIESNKSLAEEHTLKDDRINFDMFGFASVILLSHEQVYELSSKLSVKRHFEPKIRDLAIGKWTFMAEPTKLPNFEGRKLRVVTFNCPIYVLMASKNDSKGTKPGLEEYLFNEFSRYLNYTWTMNDITHDEGRFGIKLGNGSWTGAIRELINGKADVFYCGLWINLHRAEAIGFTSPLLQQEITFFVPLERGLQWSWISLFLPFTVTVWVIAFTVLFLLTFVLYVAAHITKYCPSLKRISFLPRYRRYSTCFIHVYGIISTFSPPNRKRRSLLFIIMQVYSFLLIASYNSKIRDEMMTPEYVTIKDIQELVEMNYDWAEPKSTNSQIVFNVNNKWHMKFMNKNKVVKPMDIERILARRRTAVCGKTITRNIYMLNYKLNPNTLRKLKKVNEVTSSFNMAFGLVKNSRYTESFNRIITRATDSGLIDFLSHRAAEAVKEELLFTTFDKYKLTNYIQLSYEHIQGVLMVYLVGIAISSIAFLHELYTVEKGT